MEMDFDLTPESQMADGSAMEFSRAWDSPTSGQDDYIYHNVDTCPDCASGMIRQGRCCVCPSCGYERCGL